MKLTDKDLLEDAVQSAINIMEANGVNMISASALLAIINGAPTIDAIPVEWLRGLMIEYANINTPEHAAYSGMWARVGLDFFGYNNRKQGIGCGLGNVQKVADDEPLGAERASVESDFGGDDELRPAGVSACAS